ncbi:hypothetical protein DMY87_03725 [Rhizobium wuzhouense]|uniref:Uncharacterized protein n=2 Tax=Rhizobium wuzhouense TaxID=1986026 RepID=A0ABX5P0I1_9HYPH|nr:hypothetical protein DMY87_03725 [Rhizobium wuzhouense]
MLEPHMILAILSLQKTCERPSGRKEEDAFYQRYREPIYRRFYQRWIRLSKRLLGHRQPREAALTSDHPVPAFEPCR